MIFNQQALLLYGTENSEQKAMILIQGKRAIYFKYFCRMAEVIYSVIIRHIVKWTIVKSDSFRLGRAGEEGSSM